MICMPSSMPSFWVVAGAAAAVIGSVVAVPFPSHFPCSNRAMRLSFRVTSESAVVAVVVLAGVVVLVAVVVVVLAVVVGQAGEGGGDGGGGDGGGGCSVNGLNKLQGVLFFKSHKRTAVGLT
jgi:hypothetical protein